MTKNDIGSLADFIISQNEKQGFTISEVKGMPGHETVTFRNDKGEERTVQFGLSNSAYPRKNIRVYFNKNKANEILTTE